VVGILVDPLGRKAGDERKLIEDARAALLGLRAVHNRHADELARLLDPHRAREEGLKVFDFGRSKLETGAFDFKKNWGFEPQRLHYQYLLVKATEMPNLSPKNPKFRLMVNTWQKLPVPVANALGPFVAKYLG
jgi:hypothetical protein